MNQVRIHGDPFGDGADGVALRSFLRLAVGLGVRCSLSLTGIPPRPCGGEREAVLDNGWSAVRVRTWLPDAEIAMIESAAATAVATTAPVVVFVPREQRGDAQLLAGWEWSDATAVLVASEAHQPQDLLQRVRAEWRWGGLEQPKHGLPERLLHAWLELPPLPATGPFVHVVDSIADAGTDTVLAAWAQTAPGGMLRIVAHHDCCAGVTARIERVLGKRRNEVELVVGPPLARHFADAVAVLQPWHAEPPTALVVTLMASGRPLVASSWGDCAEVLGDGGCHFALAGTVAVAEGGQPRCTIEVRRLVEAMEVLRADAQFAARVSLRARRRVQSRFVGGRAAVPPPSPRPMGDARPVVLVQGPVLSGTAEGEAMRAALTAIDTSEVRLMIHATGPFPSTLEVARTACPDLLPLLARQSDRAELRFAGDGGWNRLPHVVAEFLQSTAAPGAVPVSATERIVTIAPAPARPQAATVPTVE
jgi:hypothetical protein